MNRTNLLLVFLFAGLINAPRVIANDEAEVIRTVENNLASALNMIPEGYEAYFGFDSRSDFGLCTVGKPYRVITFSIDLYENGLVAGNNYLLELDEWRVPVILNGESKLLVTVNRQDTGFVIGDVGGAALAAELQLKQGGLLAGKRFLLRVFPMHMDLLVIADDNVNLQDAAYYPLTSAVMAMKLNEGQAAQALSLDQVLKAVKDLQTDKP